MESPQEPSVDSNELACLPLQNYCLIAWSLGTSGRRLIDEIYHVAAYTPEETFSEHILSSLDQTEIANVYKQSYGESSGLYRSFVNKKQQKNLQTTESYVVLTDFLKYLETVNEQEGKCGVLLISHEYDKFYPYIFLKILEDHNMMERFCNIVKGFVDGYQFAKHKYNMLVSHDLKTLAKFTRRYNSGFGRITVMAQLTYEIMKDVCVKRRSSKNATKRTINPGAIKEILQFTKNVDQEKIELNNIRAKIIKQDSFKPIFQNLLVFSGSKFERARAVKLRSYLVDCNVDYEKLKKLFQMKGERGIYTLFREKLSDIPKTEREKLSRLVTNHFKFNQTSFTRGTSKRNNVKKQTSIINKRFIITTSIS